MTNKNNRDIIFIKNTKRGISVKNNKGWIYLNTKGKSSFNDTDGSWGHIEEDGSGSYHGADGSWGYKDKNGSASYHSTDGGRSYGEKDHNSEYYPSSTTIQNADDNNYSSNSYHSKNAYVSDNTVNSILRELRADERRENRRKFCKKHWKALLAIISISIIALAIAIGILEYRKMIPMQYSSTDLIGLNYETVVTMLNDAGFTNIFPQSTEDLNITNIERENTVYQIYIMGKNSFTAETKYPYDIWITVKYHAIKPIAVPITSKDAKGKNYIDVVSLFQEAGFINVKTIAKPDIITGWFTDDGEIESITINGEKRFSLDSRFRPDAEIIITYHTFKDKQ